MLRLVFALTGLILGMVLAYLAPEEIHAGKKYLLWLKKIIFGIIMIFLIYLFFILKDFIFLILPLLLLIFLILELKLKHKYLELGYYLVFIISFLLQPSSLLAVLIFLYSLPAGTLLLKKLT